MTYIIKQRRKFTRRVRKRTRYLAKSLFTGTNIAVFVALFIAGSFILVGVNNDEKNIYTAGLLDTIAKVESNSNYNAYFGNAKNSQIAFTTMPVKDVLAWQQAFVAQGNASSAVGRYQFIDSTLRGLVMQLKIDQNAVFNETLQDTLATALLERRGLREYIDKQISREEFAHNLSKEWAALPRSIGENPQQSYYADDGLNKARLTTDELFSSIATLREM
ncbi:hypothetical protein EON76_04525 [bacterium]|nr:MAG: hypothetical protein EON76_04525 [bacterium]